MRYAMGADRQARLSVVGANLKRRQQQAIKRALDGKRLQQRQPASGDAGKSRGSLSLRFLRWQTACARRSDHRCISVLHRLQNHEDFSATALLVDLIYQHQLAPEKVRLDSTHSSDS